MNTPPKVSKATYLRRRAVVLAALLTLSACGVQAGQKVASGSFGSQPENADIVGSEVGQSATSTTPQPAAELPPADVEIQGDNGSDTNVLIGNAVADLESWWTDQFPEAYGADYEPLSGGLFAIDGSTDPRGVPCASSPDISELLNNAFYCPSEDAVVWDQSDFMQSIADQFGDFTVAVVVAHEWGHAIQARSQFSAPSVVTELQADCFAGAWTKHVSDGESDRFSISTDDLDTSLTGILALRDAPGGRADADQAHGSGFDRVGAFQDGFESGVTRCAEFRDGDPVPYEFPFSEQDDFDANGNLHLSGTADNPGILDLAFPSLDAFWTDTFPTLSGGEDWNPLTDPVAFSPNDPPSCNGDPITDYVVFVCKPDRFVAFDADKTIPSVYEQGGDFAVATMFAAKYGADAVDQLGSADDPASATLQGDCFAGAWAAALLPPNPPDSYELVLSPGDLDEGVAVLLAFRSQADRADQGPAFDQVKAFRTGVIQGAEACTDIQAG